MDKLVTLPDYLAEGLDVVFVGINPGLYSASVGHYFARPGNLFWLALHESGLVPERLVPDDDFRLLKYGIGLTDVVKRPTRSASDLSKAELMEGGKVVREKIERYAPRIACFNGLTGYQAVFGRSTKPGRQDVTIGASKVFVVPSTSRRNAHYRPAEIVKYFSELRAWRDT